MIQIAAWIFIGLVVVWVVSHLISEYHDSYGHNKIARVLESINNTVDKIASAGLWALGWVVIYVVVQILIKLAVGVEV